MIPEERSKIREKLGIKEDVKDESGNVKSMVRKLKVINIGFGSIYKRRRCKVCIRKAQH